MDVSGRWIAGGTLRALETPASFDSQTFPVALPVGFAPAGVEVVDGTPRFTFVNSDGSPVTTDQLSNLEIYVTSNIGGAWVRLDNALVIVAGRVQIVDPNAGTGIRFYQVITGSGGSATQ